MEQLTLWSGGLHARDSASLEKEADWTTNAADWPGTLCELFQNVARAGSSGKTCPELCQLTKDGTSGRSSGRWTNAAIISHGVSLTLNFSERPNDAVESSLSDILETGDIPQRYYLSAKACTGILRRDGKRGELTLVSRETGRKLSTTERHSVWKKKAQES